LTEFISVDSSLLAQFVVLMGGDPEKPLSVLDADMLLKSVLEQEQQSREDLVHMIRSHKAHIAALAQERDTAVRMMRRSHELYDSAMAQTVRLQKAQGRMRDRVVSAVEGALGLGPLRKLAQAWRHIDRSTCADELDVVLDELTGIKND